MILTAVFKALLYRYAGQEDIVIGSPNANRTDLEMEGLGVGQIGIHDNFFDLGGHPLLATRIISRLKTAFQVDFPLRILFETPTIAEIAEEIDQRLARRVEPSEIKELLDELEDLSDEEAQRFVDEEMD